MLKVNEVQFNADYFNGILSAGYIPTITLPARLSDCSSLIDNIFTDNLLIYLLCVLLNICTLKKNTLSVEKSACILNNHISDHQPVVLFCDIEVPVNKHKYITIRSKSDEAKATYRP